MNCEDLDLCLFDLAVVRSEADLPEEAVVHASSCARCARAIADRARLESVLDREREIEPPPDFTAKVMGRVDDGAASIRAAPAVSMPAPSRRRVAAGFLATVTAAAAALFLVVRFCHFGPSAPQQAEAEPDAAMLAKLDLLLNWDLLDEHAEDLDLITADDLASAAKDPQEG